MELTEFSILSALLMLSRIGAAVAIAPPFAHQAVPRRLRAMIAITLTIGLLPAAKAPALSGTGAAVGAIATEIVIGLAMGLAMSLVFSAASWAGELLAHQMGLNVAESYDPGAGGEGTGLGQACWMLAVVVFFAANGHHAMLRGLRMSFDAVPVGAAVNGSASVTMLTGLMGAATSLALQIAAPVFVATLVADLAMGLAGKTLAQLGVMSAALTVRSAVGLLAVIAGAAITVGVLQSATTNWMQIVQTAIGNLGK